MVIDADFALSVGIDATPIEKGKRVAVSAADEMVTRYQNLIKILDKIPQRIGNIFAILKSVANQLKLPNLNIDEKQLGVLRDLIKLKNTELKLIREKNKSELDASRSSMRLAETEARHKVRMAEIASRGRIQADNAAFRAAESQRRRDFSEFQRNEKAKTRIAQAEASRRSNLGAGASSAAQSFGGSLSSAGIGLSATVTAPLAAIASIGVTSAISIDALRNKMIAATGSVDAANAKIKHLRDLAANSAGVLSDMAADMYSFFKPMKIDDGVIDTIIKAMGRLKMANENLDTKEFGRNLTQLFTQGFELQDLKQAVGAFPRIGEILQKQFNFEGSDLDSIKAGLNKLKAEGKLTINDFIKGFAEGVNTDSSLSLLNDTVGIRMQKMKERVFIALEPIGTLLLNVFEKVSAFVTPIIEKISLAFQTLSPAFQYAIIGISAFVAALGPVLVILGALIAFFGSVVGGIMTLVSAWTAITAAVTAAGGVFALLAGVLSTTVIPAIVALAPYIAVAVAAIGLLIAAGVALYAAWQRDFGGLQTYTIKAFTAIKSIVETSMDYISDAVSRIGGGVVAWWTRNYPIIEDIVSKASNNIRNIVEAVLNWIQVFWTAHGESIMQYVRVYWSYIESIVTTALTLIGNVVRFALQLINSDWAGAWQILLQIVENGTRLVVSVWQGFNETLLRLLQALIPILADIGFRMWMTLQEWSLKAVVGVAYIFATLPYRIIESVPKLYNAGVSIAKAIWDGIKKGMTGGGFEALDSSISAFHTGGGGQGASDAVRTTAKFIENQPKLNLGGVGGNLDKAKKAKKAKETDADGNAVPQNAWKWKEISEFAKKHGFTITSTTGGKHNVGSNHYRGFAVDVRTRDKSPQEVAEFMALARKAGLYVKDERTHPKGQKVWSGPHLHLQDARLTKDGRFLNTAKARALNDDLTAAKTETLDQISDRLTKDDRDKNLRLMIESYRKLGILPSEDLLRDWNGLMVEEAKKAGKIQPSMDVTNAEFKNFTDLSKLTVAEPTMFRELDAQSEFIKGLYEAHNVKERSQALNDRQLNYEVEIYSKIEDYNLALKEQMQDLMVELEVLKIRDRYAESQVEYQRLYNAQVSEIADVERDLLVLKAQGLDDQFTEQRRLLAAKREELDLQQEIVNLQDEIANGGVNDSLKIQVAYLRDILELRQQETNAVIAINSAQLDLANQTKISSNEIRAQVLSTLASAKTLNQTIADGLLKIGESTTNLLDKKLGKIGDIPLIGDLLKFGNQQIGQKITTTLLDALLPPDLASKFKSSGNPLLDENIKQTKYLKTIADSFTGALPLGGKTSSSSNPLSNILKAVTGGNHPSIDGILTPDPQTGGAESYINMGAGGIMSRLKGLLGKGGMFGQDGFGFNSGTIQGIGGIAGVVGGMLGGGAGDVLGGVSTGISTASTLSSVLGISALGGPVGLAIGGAIGGVAGLIKWIFGKRKQEKKDKNENIPALNKGFTDSLAKFRELIAKPPDNALELANDIRSQIASGFGIQFASKKYSKESQKLIAAQLLEIDKVPDGLMEQLKAALSRAREAKEFSNRFVATFAGGVFMDAGFKSQYGDFKRRNGMMPGAWNGVDHIPALIANNEMVLNPMQQRRARMAAGFDVFAHANIPNYNAPKTARPRLMAEGGYVGSSSNNSNSSSNNVVNLSGWKLVLENFQPLPDPKAYIESPEGKRHIIEVVGDDIDNSNGQTGLLRKLKQAEGR